METFEQGLMGAPLLMRRAGQRLQALVERIVARGNGFHGRAWRIENGSIKRKTAPHEAAPDEFGRRIGKLRQ
jgi:hypothetical protein